MYSKAISVRTVLTGSSTDPGGLRIVIRLVPIILAVLTLCGCTTNPKRPARVVIGIAISQATHQGVELAAQEIRASGGAGGIPVELDGLEWRTSQAEPAQIIKWANRFADTNDLVAVIGHSDSASTLSAAAVYNQRKLPQIVTIATNPAITNIGDWTYRLCLSDAVQGPALAEYAVKDWGKRRIAVYYVNDAYGRGLSQLFEKKVRQLGGEIVSSIMHRNLLRADDKELIRLSLNQLRDAKPELVVLFQRIPAAQWTIGAIRESGLKVDLLGGDSLGPIDFVRTTPGTEGLRISQFFAPDPHQPKSIEFVRALAESSGVEADYGRALAYDAVYLVRDAVMKGAYTRDGVKAYLDRLIRDRVPVSGAGGTYLLGGDHDARRSLYIVEVRNGKHELLKTLKGSDPD